MLWTPSDLTVNEPPFVHLIPLASIQLLSRVVSGDNGPIVISNDPGGGLIGWNIGRITYVTRTLGSTFFANHMLYEGETISETSVAFEPFANIIGLIRTQSSDSKYARAIILFDEDGTVKITSNPGEDATSATIAGMHAGAIPQRIAINTSQIGEILSDLKGHIELIHLSMQSVVGKTKSIATVFRLTSPNNPDYVHVATTMRTT
jgi:hypothetical protein